MAPEQLDERPGRADHRADLYALGVVFFEALTGRRPFAATSPLGLREQILAGEIPLPSSIKSGVPVALEHICLHCLARDPEGRYSSAEALASDLRAYLAT
jgi:eukaryotic-like serine/threonine-protein kinase